MIRSLFLSVKKPFLFLAALFAASIWLGYVTGVMYPKETTYLFNSIADNIKLLKKQDNLIKFFFIFANNAGKATFMVLAGTFFGIFPVIFVAVNGLLFGAAAYVIIAQHSLWYFLAGTVSHGIIEIPAMLLAGSYGVLLGRRYFRKITRGEPLRPYFFQALKKTAVIVFPMFAAAAFIETFFSLPLLRFF